MSVLDGAPIAALAKHRVNELADVDDALLAQIVDAIRMDDRLRVTMPFLVTAAVTFSGNLLDGPVLKGLVQTVCVALLIFWVAPPTRRRFQAVCETNGLAPHVIDALWRRRHPNMRFAPRTVSIERLAGRQGPASMGRRTTMMLKRLGGGLAVTFGALGGAAVAVKMGLPIQGAVMLGVAAVGLLVATLGPLLALLTEPSDSPREGHAEPRAPMTPLTDSDARLLESPAPAVLSRVADMSVDAADADANVVAVNRR